jgi:hypothetical protein
VIWTKAFWKGATERAIKTFAQAGVALITADAVVGLFDLDVAGLLSVSGLAALVSVLTSVGNADFTAGKTEV